MGGSFLLNSGHTPDDEEAQNSCRLMTPHSYLRVSGSILEFLPKAEETLQCSELPLTAKRRPKTVRRAEPWHL